MHSLTWLGPDSPLPDPETALPEGLLAAGADLSVARLVEAYSKGVFPWFNPGDPVLWWSPDPRMVLTCRNFKVSRSLAKRLRQIARQERRPEPDVLITTDVAFESVMRACAAPRINQKGTWISERMIRSYCQWHAKGQAHSIEIWIEGRLTGGLYGVCLGGFFFGESMFTRSPDCSKIALAYLVRYLENHGVTHIDCQQDTPHMRSLGATTMPRKEFMALLGQALERPSPPWQAGQLLYDGTLLPLANRNDNLVGS